MINGTAFFEGKRIASENGLAAIVLSSALTIGTGSVTNIPASVNGTFLYSPARDLANEPVSLTASSIRSMLHDIRSNFELSAVDLASVLGVSRQTLYDWSAERASPRFDRQGRMRELYALSAEWRKTIASNTETLSRKFSDKPVLLEILTERSLSTAAKSLRLAKLAQERHGISNTPSISDRLKELGFVQDAKAQQRMLDEQGW